MEYLTHEEKSGIAGKGIWNNLRQAANPSEFRRRLLTGFYWDIMKQKVVKGVNHGHKKSVASITV